MDQSSSDALILQSTTPFANKHIESCSGDTVRVVEAWHTLGELDRPKDGSHEDELLCSSGADEWEEGSNDNTVVDYFEFQFLIKQWKISAGFTISDCV
jgi:hypothetical protein